MGEDGTELAPGLHLVRDRDPARRAAEIARAVGVTVRSTPQAVEELLTSVPSGPVSDEDLEQIERLARRLARLSALEDRTIERAATDVNERLARAAGALAVHPETVRERAAAVESARAVLADAERAVAEEIARAQAAAALEADPVESDDEPDDLAELAPRSAAGTKMRVRQSRAIGTLVGALGLGLVLLGAGVLPLWAALVPTLVGALWASWYLRDRGERDADEADHMAVTNRLAELASEPAPAGLSPDRGPDPVDLLRIRRDTAEEEVRVAERAWRDLAGSEADVADVEDVVRRFDAQHSDGRALATVTPQVRAAQAVRQQVEDEWSRRWVEMGQEPPAAAEAVVAVATLRSRLSRPAVLIGAPVDQARLLSSVLHRVPVVLVEAPVGPPSGPAAAQPSVS